MKEIGSLQPMTEADDTVQRMAKLALAARANAYARYSGYQVGSAVIDERGQVHVGCNVENAVFSGVCAERNAIGAMVASGGKRLVGVVVVAGSSDPAMPCGFCRQTLHEFGPDAWVATVSPDLKNFRQASMRDILPFSFSTASLKG